MMRVKAFVMKVITWMTLKMIHIMMVKKGRFILKLVTMLSCSFNGVEDGSRDEDHRGEGIKMRVAVIQKLTMTTTLMKATMIMTRNPLPKCTQCFKTHRHVGLWR